MLPAFNSIQREANAMQDSICDLLSGITRGIDARFVEVGNTLAQAVESIDGIVTALQGATSSFQSGNGAAAVGNLTLAARRLSGVGLQIENRADKVDAIRGTARRLTACVEEVLKELSVLHIYGLNVKIAASGADTFVDFANTMSGQLNAGEVEVAALKTKLEELGISLGSMEHHDRLLTHECQRVVPQVPDRLETDAAELRKHQAMLAELADNTAILARSIQANVCGVLAAIQVGDIARQCLEHVLDAYRDLHSALAESQLGEEERRASQSHVVRLLLAHVSATADQFNKETRVLVASLRGLVPEADRLIALSRGSRDEDGHAFLRNLETGIAEADAMITQLRKADHQAGETLRVIVDTVDDVSERVEAMRVLRIKIQHMSLNIGVRCRRVESISKPVAVIAEAICSLSDKLDITIKQISGEAEALNAALLQMRQHSGADDAQNSDGLAQSLSAIREGAERTEHAMSVSQSKANGLLGALRSTTDELEKSLDMGDVLNQLESLLTAELGPQGELEDRPDHPVRGVLERMARRYTMVSERIIHDQFLLPGMTPLISAQAPSPVGQRDAADDDDGLFDDGLF